MDPQPFLATAIGCAVAAGAAVLEVYASDFEVEYKTDDSPLTLADRRSHEIIARALENTGIPLLSEESRQADYERRKSWQQLWVVDPLDGTKEFIKRNGEFTVNIALVENGRPVLGTIFVPVKQLLYFGARELGSFRLDTGTARGFLERAAGRPDFRVPLERILERAEKLPVEQSTGDGLTIVGSRSHANAELKAYVERKREECGRVDFLSAGSSLKFCLVAEGRADIYPRLGPTMEWDNAAGQAIAENAGARVVRYDDRQPLEYNKEDLHNPWFVVERMNL